MIITVTLNPALDKTMTINNFILGSVNRCSYLRKDAGGKGINVSKVIKSFGGESTAIAVLGGSSGKFIKDYLDGRGITNKIVKRTEETRTNIKIVDDFNGINTEINEIGEALNNQNIADVEQFIFEELNEGDIVAFSGSIPQNTDPEIYKKWIIKAKKKNAVTILDADSDYLKYGIEGAPNAIKPNLLEFERYIGRKMKDNEDIKNTALKFISEKGIQYVVVTMGSNGAVFVTENKCIYAKPVCVQVKSTVGAGDSVVASIAYSIERGLSLEEMAILSMAASSANVAMDGTETADYEFINELKKQVKLQTI